MSRSTKIFLGVAGALVVGAGAFFLLSKDGGTPFKPKPSPTPVPRADFKVTEVVGVDAKDRPEAAAKAEEESARVVALMNSYYDSAFLDPKKWKGGAHVELSSLFVAEAQPTVTSTVNLGSLALADLVPSLKRVTPTRQEISKLSFFIADDLSAPFAILTGVFEAEATTVAKKDGPVKLTHATTFWLVRDGDAYRIAAYTTELKADTVSKSAAFRGDPNRTLAGAAMSWFAP